jgi:RNA polymerase primary sigma factor
MGRTSEIYKEFFKNYPLTKYKLLTSNEERELVKKRDKGDTRAVRTLVERNLSLLFNTAIRFYKSNKQKELELEDLIHNGFFGLYRAAEKFEEGSRFGTYATNWIENEIKKYLRQAEKTIKLPEWVCSMLSNKDKETILNARREDLESIAFLLGSSKEVVLGLRKCTNKIQDEKLNRLILENLPSREYEDQQSTKEYVSKILAILSKKERRIIEGRYGLNGKKQTKRELGEKEGNSIQGIGLIEKRAIGKLRSKVKLNGLSSEVILG